MFLAIILHEMPLSTPNLHYTIPISSLLMFYEYICHWFMQCKANVIWFFHFFQDANQNVITPKNEITSQESEQSHRYQNNNHQGGLSISQLNMQYETPIPDYTDTTASKAKYSNSEIVNIVSFLIFLLAWIVTNGVFFSKITAWRMWMNK